MLFTEPDLTNCIGRDLGGAARLLGQPAKARIYYEQGITACLTGRHRPELALCRLELAELLLDEALGDQPSALRTEDGLRPLTADELKADGLNHLDFAIGELREMNMQTFLERALRRKMQLQGPDTLQGRRTRAGQRSTIEAVAAVVQQERPDLRPHAAPDGTVTILFSDIEGYSAMTSRLGDERAQEIIRAHHDLVRKQIAAHGGFEVKSQGDSFMIAFASARRALQCSIAIQRAIGADETLVAEGVRVRIGLHTGEAIKEGDDFYGTSVILAARIAARAQGGQILVSELLRTLVGSLADIELRDAGRKQLKGLPGRQRVYEAVWEIVP
jgi:class 3 adenylate cyclase